MSGGATNPKRSVLNPNWAELQQKLKPGRRLKPSNHSLPGSDAPKPPPTTLGKRKERPDSDATSSLSSPPPSVLTPTSTDCSLTSAIAMDCEMVGVSTQGNKSALGRVTLVNAWSNVVYDEYVRPLERVVDFRTRISGIRPKDLRKAKEFPAVQYKVAELIKGKILVGHALHNDLKALLLTHPKKDIRDTSEYQPFLREGRRRALRDLASQILGIKIQQEEHCSVEDARAVMLIYQKNKKEWEKSIKEQFWLRKKLKKHKHKETHGERFDRA